MPRTIVAVVDDLFFASKIRGTAEQAGVSIAFPRSADGVAEAIAKNPPGLIICDLHAQKVNPIELARNLKSRDQTKDIPLLGFFSHVQTALQREAEEAGFDQVMPRSGFTRNLPEIIQSVG